MSTDVAAQTNVAAIIAAGLLFKSLGATTEEADVLIRHMDVNRTGLTGWYVDIEGQAAFLLIALREGELS